MLLFYMCIYRLFYTNYRLEVINSRHTFSDFRGSYVVMLICRFTRFLAVLKPAVGLKYHLFNILVFAFSCISVIFLRLDELLTY